MLGSSQFARRAGAGREPACGFREIEDTHLPHGKRGMRVSAESFAPVRRPDGKVGVSDRPDVLPGHPEVLVIGDLAAIECDGKAVPGVAPAAIQQGKHAAQQVRADLEGRARVPFRYRDKGSLATIGRARAVADLPGLRFSGLPAWLAWLGIHVFFLIGFRNRLFVILSWAWSYVTFRRGARIITNVTQGMGRPRSG